MKTQTAPKPEVKMAVANPFPGSITDPAVWDRANHEAIAARPKAEPRDFDLQELQTKLTNIRDNRAHFARILSEAESDLSALENREKAAKEVLKRFTGRTGREPRVAIAEANEALEVIAEQRTSVERRQRQAENALADLDHKEKEFPRARYERLREEEDVTRRMRAR
jgi:hypothetical protein